MATIEHGAEIEQDAAVFDWRLEQLLLSGYPMPEALLLARARSVDLRLAARLLDVGCPPETAARILA
jgi:hypothetical protein